MPLSPPPERELLHSRDIVLRGYLRVDGLYDIEAHLTDTKTYGSANRDRGYIHAGEPIHGMWLRLTVDEERRIVACEASSDHTPYAICPAAAPNFARLAGLQIKPGFLKEAAGGSAARGLYASAGIAAADGDHRLPDDRPGPGATRGRCRRRDRWAGQRPPGHAHHRQDGRRAGDPEHLYRLWH